MSIPAHNVIQDNGPRERKKVKEEKEDSLKNQQK